MKKGSEKLEIYDLKGNLLGIQGRKEYYEEIRQEFKETGKVTRKIKSIRLLALTSKGRIYIQRRSLSKQQNAGLHDKTTGGHVRAGHTWFMTVIQECHEELGFPAVVLNEDEFKKAILNTNLEIIGLFRRVDYIPDFYSIRKTKNGDFIQPFITSMYIGYYDGSIRFRDGESTGIEVFTVDELKEELKKNPENFTADLKFMLEKYESYLTPLSDDGGPVYGFDEKLLDQKK